MPFRQTVLLLTGQRLPLDVTFLHEQSAPVPSVLSAVRVELQQVHRTRRLSDIAPRRGNQGNNIYLSSLSMNR